MRTVAILVALMLVAFAAPALAMNADATSDNYFEKSTGMLVDGTVEVLHAPSELLVQPYDRVIKQKNYTTGLFEGLGHGTYRCVERLFGGVASIGGALIPGFHGIGG